ncbi:MAG TPA: bifunctional tRNA (5-methylaminomethyl-2-thiouridine)(34)-methyltransferase MnmD/FAD-dependent 5-carboxymethylaminomethyl-2-thiouridine(34) oxidoreductase MnmC, partial [Quisquiliibacterium sp.]|nr:bifunctional tRNA (5-methylaminomethyl-2-thiouridine)(34)-methyltransferase MnmD/FAD-dependent 5-carboxymethylaminomethyl-2-thiouridine(34) oxidoreductase MnmC [Quisquiliibacterium sp.]
SLRARAGPGACGFRYAARDRLPMIGALPDEAAVRERAPELARNDRLELPLMPGVYGAFAFGSRGLLWSGLAGEILAALIDGGAAPVESDLLAAVAPSRFLRQQLRRRRLR